MASAGAGCSRKAIVELRLFERMKTGNLKDIRLRSIPVSRSFTPKGLHMRLVKDLGDADELYDCSSLEPEGNEYVDTGDHAEFSAEWIADRVVLYTQGEV